MGAIFLVDFPSRTPTSFILTAPLSFSPSEPQSVQLFDDLLLVGFHWISLAKLIHLPFPLSEDLQRPLAIYSTPPPSSPDR